MQTITIKRGARFRPRIVLTDRSGAPHNLTGVEITSHVSYHPRSFHQQRREDGNSGKWNAVHVRPDVSGHGEKGC